MNTANVLSIGKYISILARSRQNGTVQTERKKNRI